MIKSRLKLLIAQREIESSQKLTYERLADEIGLSRNTVGRLAENKTDRIDFLTLDKLCTYFGCTIGDILMYEPD